MKRIAAIWNRPAVQAGQAGAALGAAVAAAVALVPEGERETQAETLRQAIFTGGALFSRMPRWSRPTILPAATSISSKSRLRNCASTEYRETRRL